ncbi:MAG: hypothetical protein U0172_14120 [Nitrospiraceae bacterium]
MTLLLSVSVFVQSSLDQRNDLASTKVDDLANLPKGQYLRPALLGYHHIGADVLWLRTLQVLGKRSNTVDEHAWLYHAFDVITELDPQYDYAYWVSGVVLTELAGRPDLSNRLLERGLAAVPNKWLIPYLLAYNNYFHLGNIEKAVEYAKIAAQVPDSPAWLVNMVTQMSTQAGNPEFALRFLTQMYQQQADPRIKESLEYHIKEVIIEKDIRALDPIVQMFHGREHRYPTRLAELVTKGYLTALPQEPFGGAYLIEEDTGRISSSLHPQRLKMYAAPGSESRKRESAQ